MTEGFTFWYETFRAYLEGMVSEELLMDLRLSPYDFISAYEQGYTAEQMAQEIASGYY